ncbi:hypothetical protein LBMAG27_25680 [Bacteroidota bacterium]|nr:hypothetical protein LBMAG27_25680 [Bacteroidota bacterium]
MKKIFLLASILINFNAIAQVPNYIPTNGLQGWWPFTGNANDDSGNGNNGTVTGSTLTTDRNGIVNTAYSFNGAGNHIDVNDVAPLRLVNTDYSISCWVYFNAFVEQDLISKRATGVNNGYDLSTHLNQLAMPFTPPIYSNTISDLTWLNVVIVYNNSLQTMDFYVNGTLNSSSNSVPSPNSTTNNLRFGGDIIGTYWHNGKLDDIGIWNRALSTSEIQNIYTGTVDTCFFTVYDTIHVTVYDTTFVIDTLDGINFRDLGNIIKVFPNPTHDKITIDNENYSAMKGYQIVLTNSLGEKIFQSEIDRKQFVINLLPKTESGLFYIQVLDKNNNIIEVRKIIVQ